MNINTNDFFVEFHMNTSFNVISISFINYCFSESVHKTSLNVSFANETESVQVVLVNSDSQNQIFFTCPSVKQLTDSLNQKHLVMNGSNCVYEWMINSYNKQTNK